MRPQTCSAVSAGLRSTSEVSSAVTISGCCRPAVALVTSPMTSVKTVLMSLLGSTIRLISDFANGLCAAESDASSADLPCSAK